MVKLSPSQLKAIMPMVIDTTAWSDAVSIAADQFGINTPQRLAAFLAQIGYESVQFTRRRENLSYSVRALRNTWPGRFPTDDSAMPYARNPEKLANLVYANRLGNGDVASGDGWKYRGGGLIQLTGRANYRAAGEGLGLPLEDQPQRVEQPIVAARTAGWFWQTHGCNELADAGEFEKITETINGPAKLGQDARVLLWLKAKQVLGCGSTSA